MKWAGRTKDIMRIVMHDYIWSTHLHTTELEMNAMLIRIHYMMNIIHATPRYHLMPTLLVTESFTIQPSGENWKSAATVYCFILLF